MLDDHYEDGLRLRPARRGDIDDIVAIHVSCWRELYQFMPSAALAQRDEAFRRRQWEAYFDEGQDEEAAFVLEPRNGPVVGFCHCLVNRDPDVPARGEMRSGYILPDWRRGTVGARIMRQMALWLGDRELDPMVLYAFKGNPNRRIYTALGWHPAIERDRMIAGTPVPEIGYVWSGATELLRKLDRWQASIREREAAAHRQSRTRRAPVPSTSAA